MRAPGPVRLLRNAAIAGVVCLMLSGLEWNPAATALAQDSGGGAAPHGSQGADPGRRGGGPQGRFGPDYGGLQGGGRNPSGYYGGRSGTEPAEPPEEEPAEEEAPPGNLPTPPDPALGTVNPASSAWCRGYRPGMADADRLSPANRRRLEALIGLLSPAQDTTASREPFLILAGYQAEMEKHAPDLQLAGTYLGLVATIPVTPGVVEVAGRYLCLPDRGDATETIVAIAEAQRRADGSGGKAR